MEPEDGDVARARAGDEGAFRVLVERHAHAVFRLAFRLTGNEHDAEDVVQEAFLKAYRQIGQFEERSQFGSWLHRIAANCAYDLLRSRQRRSEDPIAGADGDDPLALPAPAPSPERLAASREIDERVARALRRLSAQERAAFLLRHREGFSLREIGAVLGCDTDAVKQSVCRAVRKLRFALAPLARAEGVKGRTA